MIQKFMCWLFGHKRQYTSTEFETSTTNLIWCKSTTYKKYYKHCPRCGYKIEEAE